MHDGACSSESAFSYHKNKISFLKCRFFLLTPINISFDISFQQSHLNKRIGR